MRGFARGRGYAIQRRCRRIVKRLRNVRDAPAIALLQVRASRRDGSRQQVLGTDVLAFRHLERIFVCGRCDQRVAAAADGAHGAVPVADVLEGEARCEAEGDGLRSHGKAPNSVSII